MAALNSYSFPQTGEDLSRSTRSLKPSEVTRQWLLIDATDKTLGRLAAEVAKRLRGKHKAQFTPHVDCGDAVVIINCERVHLTGNKIAEKTYFRHTGHPGGLKRRSAGNILGSAHADRVIEHAVHGMMGRGPLVSQQLRHLYIYTGSDHPHAGQEPSLLDIAALNVKNEKGRDMSEITNKYAREQLVALRVSFDTRRKENDEIIRKTEALLGNAEEIMKRVDIVAGDVKTLLSKRSQRSPSQ